MGWRGRFGALSFKLVSTIPISIHSSSITLNAGSHSLSQHLGMIKKKPSQVGQNLRFQSSLVPLSHVLVLDTACSTVSVSHVYLLLL